VPEGRSETVNIAEVILIYACIPLAVVLIVSALVFGPGYVRKPRYRPGEPWQHEPVWYGPHPSMLDEELQQLLGGDHAGADHSAPMLTARTRLAIAARPTGAAESDGSEADADAGGSVTTARGGAHGDW
jgi:hypothetical protein